MGKRVTFTDWPEEFQRQFLLDIKSLRDETYLSLRRQTALQLINGILSFVPRGYDVTWYVKCLAEVALIVDNSERFTRTQEVINNAFPTPVSTRAEASNIGFSRYLSVPQRGDSDNKPVRVVGVQEQKDGSERTSGTEGAKPTQSLPTHEKGAEGSNEH